MVIKGYGVVLRRIHLNDLELIRKWRNSDKIRRRMFHRKHITKAQQIQWFHQINNEKNNYFIIENNNIAVGLINGGEIDWIKNITGNGGIFIWENDQTDDLTALKASILITDCGFYLGMKMNYIKVLKNNTNAILYNKMLGYKVDHQFQHPKLLQYFLTPEAYFESTSLLRKKVLTSNEIEIVVSTSYDNSTQKILQRMNEMNISRYNHIKLSFL